MSEGLVAAVGIATSPFAVIPAILLLFTRRPRACAGAFAGGWFVGVAVVTGLAVLLADLLTLPEVTPRWASWARVVFGVLLLVAGAWTFVRRSPDAPPPSWMATLEGSTPRRALRFGLIASAPNPKVTLLALAGGFAVGADATSLTEEVVAVLVFALVATSTALVPLVAYLLRGDRALGTLGRAKDWLTKRSDVVMSAIMVVFGILLVWKGWGAL